MAAAGDYKAEEMVGAFMHIEEGLASVREILHELR